MSAELSSGSVTASVVVVFSGMISSGREESGMYSLGSVCVGELVSAEVSVTVVVVVSASVVVVVSAAEESSSAGPSTV